MVRYAKLSLSFDAAPIKAGLHAIGGDWRPHMNTFHYTGSWDVLALRSPGGEDKNIVPELLGKHSEYLDTIYMVHFPPVKALIARLKCPVMSARFLNLKAGAVIKQHRDNDLAFEKGEARLHFPVITNPRVEFYCEDDRIILQEGQCWYLNANLPHRVSNNGDEDRIHLVIDCKVNDWLKDVINSAPEISFKEEGIDENHLEIIKMLREQNTETSNKLADQLEQRAKSY